MQPSIPELTHSSLHRCLQRHGISRLLIAGGEEPGKKRFKAYPTGTFHIDVAKVRTEGGKLSLFVAMDRTSKLAVTQLHEKATRQIATDFLHARGHPDVLARLPAGAHRTLPRLRPCLREAPHRAPADQAVVSLDQWPGRTHGTHA